MPPTVVPIPKWSCLAVALVALAADHSLSHAQFRPAFRGTPSSMAGGFPTAGFPGLPGIPLVNNGSLQISRNPNPTFPNATPFSYIASLPLGDRLPYNGILADPQLLPQTIYGQQLAQNILQGIQQQQFGNPLGPVGGLLQTGLANPGVNGQPIVQAARGGRIPSGYFPSYPMGVSPDTFGPGAMMGNWNMMAAMNMMNAMNMMYNANLMYGGLANGQNNVLNANGQPVGFMDPNAPMGNMPNANVDLTGFGNGFKPLGGF